MPELPCITIASFTSAPDADRQAGLLGWLTFDVAEAFVLDGVALRRSAAGRLYLSFPARRDRAGRDHPYVRPLTPEARRALEAAVLRELGPRLEEAG